MTLQRLILTLFPPAHTTIDKGHGRLELRDVWTSNELNSYLEFSYVAQCFCIQRNITKLISGKQSEEIVYGVTSLGQDKADPSSILNLARGHWAIENRLHWVRDVTFDEDRNQTCKKNGPHIMASIRNIAISLLRLAGACNIANGLPTCSRLGQGVLRLIGITDLL